VFASDAFLDLTGFPREEVLGRNCRFLQVGLTVAADGLLSNSGLSPRTRIYRL
jgi:PAS domain-containing protein